MTYLIAVFPQEPDDGGMLPIRETFWLQKGISEAFSWPGVTYILLFSHKNMTMEICCVLGKHFDYRRVFPKHFLAWCDLYLAVFPQEHDNGGMLPIRETFWLQKSISEAFSWTGVTYILLFSHKNMTMEVCCLLGRHFDYRRVFPKHFPGLVWLISCCFPTRTWQWWYVAY